MPSSRDSTFVQRDSAGRFQPPLSCACTVASSAACVLQIVIQLRPRDCACLSQRGITLGVYLGQLQLCLRLGQLSLGLVEAAWKGRGSISYKICPVRTCEPSL